MGRLLIEFLMDCFQDQPCLIISLMTGTNIRSELMRPGDDSNLGGIVIRNEGGVSYTDKEVSFWSILLVKIVENLTVG